MNYAEGVGEFQRRVVGNPGIYVPINRNAESVGEWMRRPPRETPSEFAKEYGGTGSQGCSNPGLELANAFSVMILGVHLSQGCSNFTKRGGWTAAKTT